MGEDYEPHPAPAIPADPAEVAAFQAQRDFMRRSRTRSQDLAAQLRRRLDAPEPVSVVSARDLLRRWMRGIA